LPPIDRASQRHAPYRRLLLAHRANLLARCRRVLDTCLPKSVALLNAARVAQERIFGPGRLMSTDDPIIAAIEAHRRACAETRTAYERQSDVERELGAGIRVPAGEAESDPRWLAANEAAREALAMQDDLAVKLLETQPTTIAGAAALLNYYADVITTRQQEVVFPELDMRGRLIESQSIDEPRRDFGYFIVRNVAGALNNIAATE
jgi:hypothetical protein